MAESVLEMGENLEIWRVQIDELREQDLNARAQNSTMFSQLKNVMARDKRMESLPLVANVDGQLEIVSGHHRVRAARAAGLQDIFVICEIGGLTRDEIKAKQLAHNAIQGEDDPDLVRRIYQSIEDVNLRIEAFIDPVLVEEMPAKVSITPMDYFNSISNRVACFLALRKRSVRKSCRVD